MKPSSSKELNPTTQSLRGATVLRRFRFVRFLSTCSLLTILFSATPSGAGIFLRLGTASGITVSNAGFNHSGSFGTMNGIGVGTPGGGVSVLPATLVTGGALYYSTINFRLQFAGSPSAAVTAYVSTPFGHPLALIAQSCPDTASCTVAANYQTLPNTLAAAIPVVSNLVNNGSSVTAWIAIFVPYNQATFAGADSVVITFVAKNGATTIDTSTLTLNNEAVQSAIAMGLSTDPSGVTVSNTSDFSLNFGNVNGLGISPTVGLTTSSVAGGMLYKTPYVFQPSFAGFGATTAKVTVYASMDFLHPAILELRDSTTSGGAYTAISKIQATPTVFGSGFSNFSVNQRFLGLFVSSVNGATAFTGSDTAILTFTTTPQ